MVFEPHGPAGQMLPGDDVKVTDMSSSVPVPLNMISPGEQYAL